MSKKLFCGIFFAVILVSASQSIAQEGTLLVGNRTGGSVSMIDLATGVEVARLPIGPIIPHEVHASPDGRLAITTEYGPNSNPGRHVVLIDIVNAQIVGRIDLGPNSRPHTAVFLPDSRHAVATMQDSDQLALIDTATLKVIKTFPTGAREGHMVRLSPGGERAYVTSRGNEGHLSVIYLDDDRPPTVIETGTGAEGIGVSPDGSEVWVANRGQRNISVIDTQTLEVVDVLPAHPQSSRVQFNGEGLVAVPNGTAGEAQQYVRVYEGSSREFLREAPIHEGAPLRGSFGIFALGDNVYISDPGRGSIQIFNIQTMGEPETLAVGLPAPDGMDWSPLRVGVLEN